jgi:hypothetical protein
MPADHSVLRSKNITNLSTSAVWVAFTQLWDEVEVESGEASGGDTISFVVGDDDTTAPTSLGDNTFIVRPGGYLKVRLPLPGSGKTQAVKLIASGAITSCTVTGIARKG